jgi:hypothetical protein
MNLIMEVTANVPVCSFLVQPSFHQCPKGGRARKYQRQKQISKNEEIQERET